MVLDLNDTETASGGGPWDLIDTETGSGENTHSFGVPTGYDVIRLTVRSIDPEGNGDFKINMVVNDNSAVNYRTRSSDGAQTTQSFVRGVIDSVEHVGSCIWMVAGWDTGEWWGYAHTGEDSSTEYRATRFHSDGITSPITQVALETDTGETFGFEVAVEGRDLP